MIKQVFLIFIGGGLGSAFRYIISKWVGTLHTHYFPAGTLAANIMACLILGFLVGMVSQKQDFSNSAKLFWTVGFCGGFSTFSTFSLEVISLHQSGYTLGMLSYIGLSLALCLVATIAGTWIGQSI